ncbi:hemolysin-III family protein [Rutstroemia sp. NJR-2017a BBW]|nr:hemolysin-III family protein [Rutstroemia sp. NJR-2017a BBW]
MASTSRLRVPPPQPPEAHKGWEMEFISDTASKVGRAGRPALLSFDEMPEWFRRESNQWILHGYRPISGSAHTSFCSWLYIHNESVNIYSHFIPAVFFLFGEWYIKQYLTSRYSGVTGADFIAFSIFMLTAVVCLSLSATYHTLMNHSQHVEHFCLRLDMLGVVIFILGDLVLGIYMVFWCEPLPRNIYWSLGSKYRLFRALMFVATGLSISLPISHTRETDPNAYGSEDQVSRKSISWHIRPMGLPFDLSHPGGMRRCGPVDRVSGCLRLCSRKSYLLVSLTYVYMPSMELLATEMSFQTLTV